MTLDEKIEKMREMIEDQGFQLHLSRPTPLDKIDCRLWPKEDQRHVDGKPDERRAATGG